MSTVDDVVEYPDNVDDLRDERCWDEGEHVAITTAVINYGRRAYKIFTELCIFCNLKVKTWREYADDFRF